MSVSRYISTFIPSRKSICLPDHRGITRRSLLLTAVSQVVYARLNDRVCKRQNTVRLIQKAWEKWRTEERTYIRER
jgi:hypothetical protein